jgi:hypothetical protein
MSGHDSQTVKVGNSARHLVAVTSGVDARARELYGGFWGAQTFYTVLVNDKIWVDSDPPCFNLQGD